ncbi:MAG: hypothetical protein M0Q94_06365 [Candidatus Cloacimonetes bacterium]|nr:hypothetical protein [Candidatus Cloacimonadota bacterium]
MKKIKINNALLTKYYILPYKDYQDCFNIFNAFTGKQYKFIKVLKNNQRSYVELFEYENKKYVIKIPIEKNKRKWIRFTTLFRKGEAERALDNMQNILNMGLLTTIPVLLYEKWTLGFLTNSYYIYEYSEATPVTEEYYTDVIKILEFLHKNNFLHHDAHLDNFLVKNGKIFLLDANLKKMFLFNKFKSYYEFIYLSEMNPEIQASLNINKSCLNYKLALIYHNYIKNWRRFKKFIRGNKK